MKRRATRAERFTSSLPGVATNEDNLSSGERTRLEAKRIAEAMKLADMRGEVRRPHPRIVDARRLTRPSQPPRSST